MGKIENKIDDYLMEELMEGKNPVYGLDSVYALETPEIRKLVHMVSMKLDYNIDEVYCFVLHLLEDVNAHSAMAKVEKIFNDDIKRG